MAITTVAKHGIVACGKKVPDEICFDATSTTFSNVAVSPDEKVLVFDAVGILYLLATSGGRAHAISRSDGWARDASFAPGGASIAFVSDQDGASNLWIADLKAPMRASQITHDSTFWYRSPTWIDDSTILVQVKSVYGRSSPGKSVRLSVHRSGDKWNVSTQFERLTEEMTGQVPEWLSIVHQPGALKDDCGINAVVSSDYRSVAYGCVVDGSVDLKVTTHTGKTFTIAKRAYVRVPSSLGTENRMPRGSFTADGMRYYYSRSGRIYAFTFASQHQTEIRFTAEVKKRIRPHITPLPLQLLGTLEARAIQWPSVSPDGTKFAFVAHGKLHIADIPTGNEARATESGPDILEFAPSFSHNSQQIAFATWSEDKIGSISILDLRTGLTRSLLTDSTRFAHPSWSAGDSLVLFTRLVRDFSNRIRVDGDNQRQELVIVNLKSGALHAYSLPQRTKRSSEFNFARARFSSDDMSAIVVAPSEFGLAISSVDFGSGAFKILAAVVDAADLVILPDLDRVLFIKRPGIFQVTYSTLVRNEFSANRMETTDSKKLASMTSSTIGTDGRSRVAWCVGSTCFARDLLTDQKDSVAIHVRAAAPSNLSITVLSNVRILTMAGPTIQNGVVVIRGGRILFVGSSNSFRAPDGAVTFDLRGHTVLPGLIDVHAHVYNESPDILDLTRTKFRMMLAAGVTSIFDPQSHSESIFSLAELTSIGTITGPRVFSTGDPLYGGWGYETSFPQFTISDFSENHLSNVIGGLVAGGARLLKVYEVPQRRQRLAIQDAASRYRIGTTTEGACDLALDLSMIAEGSSALEHGLPFELANDVVGFVALSGVHYTPVLTTGCGGEGATSRTLLQPSFYKAIAGGAARIANAGGMISVGSHGVDPANGMFIELQALREGGLSGVDLLRAATINGAKKLGLDQELGSIEVGKVADLLIVQGRPDIQLSDLGRVTMISKGGVLYDSKLRQLNK